VEAVGKFDGLQVRSTPTSTSTSTSTTLLTRFARHSIQQPPGEAKKSHEAEGPQGLRLMHAYGFIDINEITLKSGKKQRLCRCRNPWGFGEWEGDWGDESDLRIDNDEQISTVFSVSAAEKTEMNKMDGTFFMAYEDWIANFTHIFVAIDFPEGWDGASASGAWDPDLGGNRTTQTFSSNPKFELTITSPSDVFIGLSTPDTRLTHGVDYWRTPLQSMPLSFDVLPQTDLDLPAKERKMIKNSLDPDGTLTAQPPYYYQAVQVFTKLQPGTYLIIPSMYKRKIGGDAFLTVTASSPLSLKSGIVLNSESAILDKPGLPKGLTRQQVSPARSSHSLHAQLLLTQITSLATNLSQFSIHVEDVREKLFVQANALGVTTKEIRNEFEKPPNKNITKKIFKQKLINLGFNLTSFPDEDFLAIDVDGSGSVSPQELTDFFVLAVENSVLPGSPPEPPEDDLLNQPTDLRGMLKVGVSEAKGLVPCRAWFDDLEGQGVGGAGVEEKKDSGEMQGEFHSVSARLVDRRVRSL